MRKDSLAYVFTGSIGLFIFGTAVGANASLNILGIFSFIMVCFLLQVRYPKHKNICTLCSYPIVCNCKKDEELCWTDHKSCIYQDVKKYFSCDKFDYTHPF